jgi:hypothetical protein
MKAQRLNEGRRKVSNKAKKRENKENFKKKKERKAQRIIEGRNTESGNKARI